MFRIDQFDKFQARFLRQGRIWLGIWLPRLHPYWRLARFDRPIGFWLLCFPCWWGLALAGDRTIGHYALFWVGAVVMRGAGCVLNDIFDRKLDAQVERTRNRPLAVGEISVAAAIFFMLGLAFIGLVVALMLGWQIMLLAFAIIPIIIIYPLMKRITWWPQLFLGLAFNWGVILGYGRGIFSETYVNLDNWMRFDSWSYLQFENLIPALLLYAAGIFWTIGYDTIYAHQDRSDDAQMGIGSTALYWGIDKTPIFICYAATVILLGLAALAAGLESWALLIMLIAIAAHFAWQIVTLRPDQRDNCAIRFRSNFTVGWLVTLGLVAAAIAHVGQ